MKKNQDFRLLIIQKQIKKAKSIVTGEYEKSNNGNIVTKSGKKGFSLTFDDPMNGYGMYHGHWFFDYSQAMFLFVQAYEHSRGGHHDENLIAISHDGKVLWQKYLYGYNSSILVANTSVNRLYILNDYVKNPEEFRDKNRIYINCNLEEINTQTGVSTFNKAIYLPSKYSLSSKRIESYEKHLFLSPFSSNFIEKRNELFVKVYFGSFAIQTMKDDRKFKIPLKEIISS